MVLDNLSCMDVVFLVRDWSYQRKETSSDICMLLPKFLEGSIVVAVLLYRDCFEWRVPRTPVL